MTTPSVQDLAGELKHLKQILAQNLNLDLRTPEQIKQAEQDAVAAEEHLAFDEGVAGRQTSEGTLASQATDVRVGTPTVGGAYHPSGQAGAQPPSAEGVDVPSGKPSDEWTVAQLDAHADQQSTADYPKSGTKAEKLKALKA